VAVGDIGPAHQSGWFSYWTDPAQRGRLRRRAAFPAFGPVDGQ
jgi:hypothetical protein